MKRILQGLALLLVLVLVSVGLLAFWYLRWDEIPPPDLPGSLQQGSLQHDGRLRTWQAYVPANLAENPALLLLLHGSRGDGAYMRASTFYGFDVLAERGGFIAIYPDGFERHWNDCRAGADYRANLENVDDVGFLQALAGRLSRELGADLSRVYVAGISNGGHMAFRLGLEAPESVAGIAAIAANLPVADNFDCSESMQPVATLVINGTADPVNPYAGGVVEIFGNTSRGLVRASMETANYWARLAGHGGAGQQMTWPERAPGDGTSVRSTSWEGPSGPPVQLLTIVGGGHTIPNPVYAQPKIIGATSHEFDSAEVIWSFFSLGAPVQP